MNNDPIPGFIFFAMAMCVGCAIIFHPLQPATGVTERNYERVETGMSVREVGEILGDGTIHSTPFRSDVKLIIMNYTNRHDRRDGDDAIEVQIVFADNIVYQKVLKKNYAIVKQEGDWIK